MSGHHHGPSHDFEPVRGLPGLLPRGETVLWRGAPDWTLLARRAFLGGPVAVYFLAIMAWRFVDGVAVGRGVAASASHAMWLGVVGLAALAIIALMAWATAKSTVYTLTNRRLVIRTGVALTLSINVPFKKVAAASLKPLSGGRGDVTLVCGGEETFSYLLLWPHVKPWRTRRPEPTLRCIPNAAETAKRLGEALAAYEQEHGIDASGAEVEGLDAEPQTNPGCGARPAGGMVAAE